MVFQFLRGVVGRRRRSTSCRWLVVAAVCAIAAVAAPGALAKPWFGFNDNSVIGAQVGATQSASLAAQEGASSSRVTLNWGWVQPTRTAANFSTYDAIYAADVARGIRPLFVLTGAPPWASAAGVTCSSGSCLYPPSNAHNADWQTIAAQIATRYPQLAGIEIWNEPNQSWAWWGGFDPARYTQLLHLAYTAIKAVNPSMPVIGSSLAADLSGSVTSTSYPAQQFLQAMYDNGARGNMDGLSIHPYAPSVDPWYAYKTMNVITEVRNHNGDNAPLWVTETGMSTTGGSFTVNDQSLMLANLVPALLAYPGVAGVYVHTLLEETSAPSTSPERGYGLLHPDLTPKPAYCAIAAAMNTGYACPSGTVVPQPSSEQAAEFRAENLLQAAAAAALTWHSAHGAYHGLTSTALPALDARLSATALTVVNPATAADPAQIGIWSMSGDGLLLCNASQGVASYCIYTQAYGNWIHGSAVGSVYSTAYDILHGLTYVWTEPSTTQTSTTSTSTTTSTAPATPTTSTAPTTAVPTSTAPAAVPALPTLVTPATAVHTKTTPARVVKRTAKLRRHAHKAKHPVRRHRRTGR
jgi:hypothetical protein